MWSVCVEMPGGLHNSTVDGGVTVTRTLSDPPGPLFAKARLRRNIQRQVMVILLVPEPVWIISKPDLDL